jgi:hypothetical protein
LLSDTEAQAIWRRAADLQSLTGVQHSSPIAERDAERDAERTSGYKVDIRGAASEAESTRYVDTHWPSTVF